MLLAALAACAGPVPEVVPGVEAARATGLAEDLCLRTSWDAAEAAVPWPPGATLREADGLAVALRNSPELQVALAEARLALRGAEGARLWANPLLSVVVRWGEGRPAVETALTAPLVELLQTPRRAAVADARLRAAAAHCVTVALDVAAAWREAYAEAVAAEAALPELRARDQLLARMAEVAASRLRAGEADASEAAAVRARQADVAVETAMAGARVTAARGALALLLGCPSAPADWPLDVGSDEPLADEDRAARALRSRPELHEAAWELQALGDEAALAALAVWRETGLGVSAERPAGWELGPSVSVPLPLFDFGGNARDTAAAACLAARHRWTACARRILGEVRAAEREHRAAHAALAAVRDRLAPLQRERLQLAEAAWRAGATGISAVLLADEERRATELRVVELSRDARIARIRLDRATAGLSDGGTTSFPDDSMPRAAREDR
ncbi:MAG: TolC family protein [Planctomycetes bacterium]|nr:TolC family protein [Planctomycetota bacterium]